MNFSMLLQLANYYCLYYLRLVVENKLFRNWAGQINERKCEQRMAGEDANETQERTPT